MPWPGIAAALIVVLVVSTAINLLVERVAAPVWRTLSRWLFSPVAWSERRSSRTS
jgi:hypothetical protein